MALIQTGRSWQDKDGILTPITAGTLTGAFGEERVLTLDYSFDQSLNDCEIYFNPALFIEQGITLEQTQTLPPSISYWYKVTAATVVDVENTMNLLNSNATERNMSVTFELNADRLSFKIRLTCFLTADILDFLSDTGIDNSIRLLGNTKNADELENLEDSVYNSADKGFGIHTGVKVQGYSTLCKTKVSAGQDGVQEDTYIAEGELFVVKFKPYSAIDKLEIFVNGILTASSGTQPDNNYGAISGFDGGGYPQGSHPNPPIVPDPNYWYIGGNLVSAFDKRIDAFAVDTGLTIENGDFQQIVWVKCQAGDTIIVRVAGTSGTIWDYEIFCPNPTANTKATYEYVDAWISANFVFLNEGTMTNPVFELSRNSIVETEFATFADTNVKLQIDYASPKPASKAKVWVIDADNTVQSLDFKKAYGYQPNNFFTVTVPSNIGGDTWETNFVIEKTKLNVSGRYFIIAVYYDTANQYVASYISQPIFVTNVQFLTPTVTGTIYNLVADFASNYVEISPLQRICCEIVLAKYLGFDTAYLGGNVQIGGETFTFLGKNNQGNFENTNRFVFLDSAGSLIIRFYLRVKEEWQNTEIDILWNINFNVEYTTITFPQRLAISQMEQNKAVPNLTEIKLYKDGVLLLEDGDTACGVNFLRVETIKNASAVNYAQAAIWKDDAGNVYEEEAWSPISVFTQSSNAFQSNVEIYFGDAGSVNNVIHDITNDVDNGEVGMVGYPPPIPLNSIRHPFHITTKTGRNVVFIAEYNYGNGKSFAGINGVTSADFLFRIGNSTTSRDANDVSWGAFSDLSFASFSSTSITAGSRIMIRYIGTATIVNIAGYLQMAISTTPVNPKIISISINPNISAGDIMLFTGLNVNFTAITYTGGTANTFTAKRTFTELANNSDLANYLSGIGNGNSPNNTLVPHLYMSRTGSAFTVNLGISQTENPNIEIGNPASPLTNKYYPVSGNGLNVKSIKGDAINDFLYIPSGINGADKLYVSNMAVGEERSFTFLGMQNGLGNYSGPEGGVSECHRYLGSSNFNHIWIGNSVIQYGFETAEPFTFSESLVNYITWTFKRKALTGTASNMYDVELYVNAKKATQTSATGSISTNTYRFSGVRFNLGMLNSLIDTVLSNSFRSQRISFLAVHKRRITLEEIEKAHNGHNIMTEMPANYYFDFTNLQPHPTIPSARLIPNLGTDSIDSAVLENHTNTTVNLYN